MDINNAYVLRIPSRPDEYNYELTTIIDNATYIMHFYYNRRAGRWILNLKDENNDPIIMGIPLLIGSRLLSRFVNEKLNESIKLLSLYNLKNTYEEVSEGELGNTAFLHTLVEIQS